MERNVRASGSAFDTTPPGKHDDLVMALALCVFWLPQVGASGGSVFATATSAHFERSVDVMGA
jgi:hypothetical protein